MQLLELDCLKSSAINRIDGPVVYFLFKGEEVVYIGCSMNFLGRIASHSSGRGKKDFDSFSLVPVPDGVAPIHLERAYIRKYRPSLNTLSTDEDDIDEFGMKALDRAIIRVEKGESIAQAAKAEKITAGVVRARYDRIRKQDEKDEFLLSYINAGQTQESLRANRDANLGIYSKGGRRRTQETEALK